jgi:hypothetical protein
MHNFAPVAHGSRGFLRMLARRSDLFYARALCAGGCLRESTHLFAQSFMSKMVPPRRGRLEGCPLPEFIRNNDGSLLTTRPPSYAPPAP